MTNMVSGSCKRIRSKSTCVSICLKRSSSVDRIFGNACQPSRGKTYVCLATPSEHIGLGAHCRSHPSDEKHQNYWRPKNVRLIFQDRC